ncbi:MULTISPECIES: porin family protein [Chitinophagaceae]
MKIDKLLLTLALICCFTASRSQLITLYADRFHWGLKGGFSFSRFSNNVYPFDAQNKGNDYYSGFKQYARATIVPGITADYQLSSRLTIGLEANYNGRGAVYRRYVEGSDYESEDGSVNKGYYYFKYRINNVEIPVMFQYRITNNDYGRAGLLLYVGASPNFNVRAKYSESDPDDPNIDIYSPSNTGKNYPLENVRKINYSLLGGLKLLTNEMPKGNFYIDARFQYDCLSTFKIDYMENGLHNMGTYNWTAGLYFGYMF